MRDPNRIDIILNEIRARWTSSPDLRLGQIIVNAVSHNKVSEITVRDISLIEDDQLLEKLNEVFNNSSCIKGKL